VDEGSLVEEDCGGGEEDDGDFGEPPDGGAEGGVPFHSGQGEPDGGRGNERESAHDPAVRTDRLVATTMLPAIPARMLMIVEGTVGYSH
jgi:hypothetical protein